MTLEFNRERTMSKVLTGLLSIGCAAVSAGCINHHVQLEAPESDAPIAERRMAYNRLQPVSIAETHITTYKMGTPVSAVRRTDYLQLQGGARVYEPEDIWPVIAQTSAAAESVKSYEDKSSTVSILNWVSAGLLTAGIGMMAYPVIHRPAPGEKRDNTLLYVGLSTATVGALALLWANSEAQSANDDKATAFSVYDDGLKSKLNLCESEEGVSDCNHLETRKSKRGDDGSSASDE